MVDLKPWVALNFTTMLHNPRTYLYTTTPLQSNQSMSLNYTILLLLNLYNLPSISILTLRCPINHNPITNYCNTRNPFQLLRARLNTTIHLFHNLSSNHSPKANLHMDLTTNLKALFKEKEALLPLAVLQKRNSHRRLPKLLVESPNPPQNTSAYQVFLRLASNSLNTSL